MKNYRREFDDDRQTFKKNPLHNWAANLSDALQQMALVWDDDMAAVRPRGGAMVALRRGGFYG